VKRFFFQFPAATDSLALVASFIMQACQEAELSDDFTGNITLVASEAVTNAIRHGARCDGELLAVTLEISDRRVSLQVIDHGPGFDLEAVPPPNLDDPSEGGYGLYIIKRLVDEVKYLRGDDANTMIMIKRIN
jgi:serine/threonine-protein kinase RsbW